MAPEHGLWGAPQDHIHITAEVDPVTMLPVHSLYGTRRTPTSKMLRGLDAFVVDLQDVGSRYYTFVWTMVLTMQACAAAGGTGDRAGSAKSARRTSDGRQLA